MGDGGDFVVAWSSMGQDGSLSGAYAQRYRADGTMVGCEFRLNSTTNNNQLCPRLASTRTGT